MEDMRTVFKEEDGFVLVVAMVSLVILSIIGIAITNISTIELTIAGNDRRIKHAFYKADGGTEVGIHMLEENFSCPSGFNTPAGFDNTDARTGSFIQLGGIDIFDANFAKDLDITMLAVDPDEPAPATTDDVPTDSYRTIRIPDDPAPAVHNDTVRHTNVAVFGTTTLAEGSAIQQSAAYHGIGYSAAGGGGIKSMDVLAQYDGALNTIGKIFLEYVHLIGTEGTCNY